MDKLNTVYDKLGLSNKVLRLAQEAESALVERFKEIDYLIKAISSDGVIPEQFEELYNTFKKAVKL